jgi:hypothetical protein
MKPHLFGGHNTLHLKILRQLPARSDLYRWNQYRWEQLDRKLSI